jgi:NitT/TauT family transport system substrate-binding protein
VFMPIVRSRRCKTQAHIAGPARTLALAALAIVILSGCVALPSADAPTVSPAPAETAPTAVPAERSKVVIYAPATPSSIPVIMAAQHMEDVEVVIFTNHAQANAEFMRGDVDILVTGLSVGVDLFKNGAPVQVIDSYVAGLTYLVTYGKEVESFADLKGQEIYLPFEGSPIEEVTQFFIEQEGLTWKTDIKPIYSPFASSVELLKQGKATAVALPEPFVTLVENQPNMVIALNYRAQWDRATGSSNGYPQVTPFVMQEWAAAHPDVIARFNAEIAAALKTIEQDPAAAVAQTQAQLGLPAEVLLRSLGRTDFAFVGPDALPAAIQDYYRTIGKPLDETFDAFFYHSPQ